MRMLAHTINKIATVIEAKGIDSDTCIVKKVEYLDEDLFIQVIECEMGSEMWWKVDEIGNITECDYDELEMLVQEGIIKTISC